MISQWDNRLLYFILSVCQLLCVSCMFASLARSICYVRMAELKSVVLSREWQHWSPLPASMCLSRSFRSWWEVEFSGTSKVSLLPSRPLKEKKLTKALPLCRRDRASLCGGEVHYSCFQRLFWFPARRPPPLPPAAVASFLSAPAAPGMHQHQSFFYSHMRSFTPRMTPTILTVVMTVELNNDTLFYLQIVKLGVKPLEHQFLLDYI